jgi:hypothetical protein
MKPSTSGQSFIHFLLGWSHWSLPILRSCLFTFH